MTETNRETTEPHRLAVRIWGTVLAVSAVLLFLGGGGLSKLRADSDGALSRDIVAPVLLSPHGELDEAPLTFRWTPGDQEKSVVHVILIDETGARLWSSRPLPPETNEVTINPAAYADVSPGRQLYWKVHEMNGGKLVAGSGFAKFSFFEPPSLSSNRP